MSVTVVGLALEYSLTVLVFPSVCDQIVRYVVDIPRLKLRSRPRILETLLCLLNLNMVRHKTSVDFKFLRKELEY